MGFVQIYQATAILALANATKKTKNNIKPFS